MALVAGEDSESSDEEINTDQLPIPTRPGIVTGEDDEDEEDEEEDVDTSTPQAPSASPTPTRLQWEPPSLLHKKLGESNLSLRRNIVDRILKLYHMTCRNLTVVNDNLSRAQGIIEKVNANVKKSDQDLVQLKASLDNIFESGQSLAPNLRMDVPIGSVTSN